jgi:nifR3 family TIM-barrel protein
MAGVTDGPFRRICRRMGADLVFSEMVSADGVVRGNRRTLEYLSISDEERPVGIQLFGHKPEVLGAAAAEVTWRCAPDFIDLNSGCPVRKVVSRKAGSALLLDLPLLRDIVSAMVEATHIPVTVKIRSGWEVGDNLAGAAAEVIQEAGASALTIHARPKSAPFASDADWSIIKSLKRSLDIPVIGNGGVSEPGDTLRMLERTGCDAVMIGRAAMGNPWMFSRAAAVLRHGRRKPEPSTGERLGAFLFHATELAQAKGELRAARQMRKQAGWYTRGLPGCVAFRRRVNECTTIAGLERAVSETLGAAGADMDGGCEWIPRG